MSRGLGKGLDALIPSMDISDDEKVVEISLNDLRPNPYQPRKKFEDDAITELKSSIEEHGVIQPIIVRKSIKGYEIIAGERRFRASKAAGLKTIPAVIKDFTETQVMEIAIIENVQREDLNAIEEAVAYQKLIERINCTQEEVAKKVGKSRSHIANILRLLLLPDNVQDYVSRGTLSMGHARALLSIKDRTEMLRIAKLCIEEGLSVRQLENLVKKNEDVSRETKDKKKKAKKDIFMLQLEEKLQSSLGTSVKIKQKNKKGKIEIDFFSNDDLERILQLLVRESD